MNKRIAVVGAGNGGQAMAAYFAMAGFEVSIYDRFQKTIDALNSKKEIRLEGAVEGVGKLEMASTNMEKIVRGRELIIVVNPAMYHNGIAKEMAPYIEEGQMIFLNPASVFGAFAFKKALEDAGCHKKVVIGESDTLLFAAHLVEDGLVNIGGKKEKVLISSFPSCEGQKMFDMVRSVIPEFDICNSVLETSIESVNAIIHPLPTIMNASWTESGAKYHYYTEGIGETVGNFIEKMDRERIEVGKKLGLELGKNMFDIYMEYDRAYNTTGDSVSKVVKAVDAYKDIYAADTVRIRYIYEDIPTGMVPFIAMGELLGVSVERMKLTTRLCEMMLEEDFTHSPESRNLENLGLAGMSAEDIVRYAETGVK